MFSLFVVFLQLFLRFARITKEVVIEYLTAPSSPMDDQKIVIPSVKSPSATLALKPVTAVRHCAYCLNICSLPVKLCGGCKKRAYCSKECQTADWSIRGTGQRHKQWCGRHDYGEEGLDWEVVPVPGKGLGVVAKRLLPAGFRIIVEPAFTDPHDHPKIKELEPKWGTLKEKFQFNHFDGNSERDGGKPLLGLRSSRLNHSCRPNAAIAHDATARVNIVFAQRDINPGEEVCVIYIHFGCLETNGSPYMQMMNGEITTKPSEIYEEFEEILDTNETYRYKWGFTCPADCTCKDADVRRLVVKGKQAFKRLLFLALETRFDEAMKAGERVLETVGQLNISWSDKAYVHFLMYEIAMTSGKMKEKAKKNLEEVYKKDRITAPYAEKTLAQENVLKNFEEFFSYQKRTKILPSTAMNSFSVMLKSRSNE